MCILSEGFLERGFQQGFQQGIQQEKEYELKRVTENYMKLYPSLSREEAEEMAKAILA